MAHFVEIDASNIVIKGVVLDDKDTQDEDGNMVESIGAKFLSDTLGLGGTWKRTDYDTHKGVHALGGTPFRKNPARKGGNYDEVRDAFYESQPHPSWTLNEDTCRWKSPTPYPDDGKKYRWDEENLVWKEI